MNKETISNNHNISILGRKSITISGIKKIDNFDDKEFVIETIMGTLKIEGEELEIIKMDTYQGDVVIKGKLDSLNYMEASNKKKKDNSIFNRLFK